MSVPNIISLARLLSTPVIVWLIMTGNWKTAFFLFCSAGISDAVDGFIAKRFNSVTRLGAYLDALADKILLVAIYITLGAAGEIPLWLVILVVSRDFLIIGGALLSYAMAIPWEMRPIWSSKINTTTQITLAAAVLAFKGFPWQGTAADFGAMFITTLIVVVAASTVFSGTSYVIAWLRQLADLERT